MTGGQIMLHGRSVTLRPRAALSLAMAFHELTTNAVKYGALSVNSGKVDLAWNVVAGAPPDPTWLRIEWRETGGPEVSEPRRRGFGSTFIERSVAAELEGTAKLNFDPHGLQCRIELPGKALV